MPQCAISDDASTKSVQPKIKKRTESECLYSQTKKGEQINAHQIVIDNLTKLTHDLSLERNDNSMEISNDDLEESEDTQVIRNNVSSNDKNCSETANITPTLARDDDDVEVSNCASAEIFTIHQSPDKLCSETETIIQTNVFNTIITEPNKSLFQSSTNHLQNTPARDEESESDVDFKKSANLKIVNKTKPSDYQYTPELTNKPLTMKIKRTPVASRKTVLESDMEQSIVTNVDCITAENSELRKHLEKEIESSTNKQLPSMTTNDFMQCKSPLDKSIEKSKNLFQSTNNDQNKSIIEYNIPTRLYEDFNKLRLRNEELTKKVEEQQYLLSLANSEIEKKKYEIEVLKNSLCNFTNPQKAMMNVEEKNECRGEIEKFSDSRSEKFKQSEDKQSNKRRQSNDLRASGEDKNITARKTKNDPRWTLKYREKQKGLVELVKNSGVYVNEMNLIRILANSYNSRELARRLMVEIFSQRALITCTLSGAKRRSGVPKPGLDKEAMHILLRLVQKRACEKNWATLQTAEQLEKHKKCVMVAMRNKIAMMRKKTCKTQEI